MKLYWDSKRMTWVDRPTKTPQARVHLQSDWEPLTSPITDEVIGGRAQYREHLRQHGCHIKEPGQEKVTPRGPDRQQINADIKTALRELGVTGG